ncbi:MAG: NERD domain-containing protein [Clostridia bacterium]|nr:NERD domain-containing protein [Clostridia bacterium]MBQ4575537.1 NERD domain-containing protein [Clostridia bacterium]
MEFIKSILPPVLTVAALLLLLFIFLRIRKQLLIKSALGAPRDRHYIRGLLSAAFPSRAVKYSVRLPRKFYSDPAAALVIDCMIISRGGITIIDIIPVKGALDNPYVGEWGIKTAEGVQNFPNPFEAGAAHAEALRKLLATGGIYNAAINVVALLQNERVLLHYNNEKILPPARLIPYIHDLDQNRFLGGAEQKKASELLERFTARAALERKNHKQQ